MKKNITTCILGFCLLILGAAHAQNTQNPDEVLVENQERFVVLDQLDNDASPTVTESFIATTNSVFIQQVGANNSVFSNINAQSSDIQLIQRGEGNLIDINETSGEIEKFISQTGSNNIVTDFSFNPTISTSLEIIQEGNDHYFERFGSNELSNNLKFKMTGEARTIIVRSF
ncbi:hypothetical protein [Aquimarina sp. RZ0]|uniref:hypothetical protein n=1 Tax=Aquimarina sp. RZ0 TaxID=2607730 RepID=UPI0011F0F2B6|nr:hypothetical protein [Aquimarina sp. RZ0]KAA1246705.1 hypothetical protein F0000_06585 [Aquimarina sp. RZ0]